MMAQCIDVVGLHIFENEQAALFVGATLRGWVVLEVRSQRGGAFKTTFLDNGDAAVVEVQTVASPWLSAMLRSIMCPDSLSTRLFFIS
jgi:hypothetical protein